MGGTPSLTTLLLFLCHAIVGEENEENDQECSPADSVDSPSPSENTVQSENVNSTQDEDEYGSFLIPEDELNSINVEIIKYAI